LITTMLPPSIFGIPVKQEIGIESLLTSVTLVAGFFWWIVTTTQARRRRAMEETKSGALRLLLYLLRKEGLPMTFHELFEQFEAVDKQLRKTYCGRNYHFKNHTTFEAAVYRLDEESKIRFLSPDRLMFRRDYQPADETKYIPIAADVDALVSLLAATLADTSSSGWDVTRVAKPAMKLASSKSTQMLRAALQSSDIKTRRNIAEAINELLPSTAILSAPASEPSP
jgi:hypothetical protein